MAIKPIQRYGKFTAPRADQSGEIRMRALAGLGKDIASLGSSIAQVKKYDLQEQKKLKEQQAVGEGIEAGLRAATENVDLVLTDPTEFGSSIRNSYAQKAYLEERKRVLQENITRIAAENQLDPQAFLAQANAYAQGAIQSISPNMSAQYELLSRDIIGRAGNAILEAKLQRDFEANDATMVDAINDYGDQVGTLLKTGNEVDALKAYNDGMAAIDSRYEAGRYANDVVYNTAKDNFTKNYQIQKERAEILRLVDDGKAEEALQRVQDIRMSVIPGFTATETEDLAKVLDTDLTQYLNDRDAIAAEKVVGLTVKQDQNAGDLFTGILSGDVDQVSVTSAFNQGNIDFDQYKVLSNAIRTRGIGTDNPDTISIIQQQIIESPEMARKLIAQAVSQNQLSTETAMTLNEKAITNQSAESPLQQGEPKRYRQSLRRILQVDNMFSEFNDDDRANRESIVLIFDEKILNGEDPVVAYKEATAQVKAVTAIAPPPYTSLVDLDVAWANGQVNDDQYKALYNSVQAYEMYKLDLKELGLE
jgi:hypothetical protein